jgi:hypothetical protein
VVDPACSAHIPVTSLLRRGVLPIRRTTAGLLVAVGPAVGTPAAAGPTLGTSAPGDGAAATSGPAGPAPENAGTGTPAADSSAPGDPVAEEPVPADWFPGERLLYCRLDRETLHGLILATRPDDVAEEMANGFTRRHPEIAVRTGVAAWQRAAAVGSGLALLAVLGTGHRSVLVALAAGLFCAAVLVRVLLAAAGATARAQPAAPDQPDADLPTYTVLVPAYQEAAVIGDTVRCLADLDYPTGKLEVLVLLERRDQETADAVRAVDPPDFVRIVALPPGPPQTKPRSVNLGLLLAAGELLVIFDAEDRPERDQLRKAANQFAAGGPRLACVQARLNFYNARHNLLTRLFSVEYAFLYDLMLPGLARLGLPVPLGGTSNHLRTEVLREVGGWDAWNVTEDADLGLRLASAGYRVEVADSTTWEECPTRPWPWIMQRTRWLKGFLLTLLVHTRRPVAGTRRFGPAGMASLVGVIAGTPVSCLLWPFAVVFALAGGGTAVAGAAMWSVALAVAAATTFAAYRRRLAWPAAALLPLYWLLHAYAGWRALTQLIRSPYTWEKTAHSAPGPTPTPAPAAAAAPSSGVPAPDRDGLRTPG